MLKKEINIKKENIITWKSFIKIDESSFTGRNPPDEIIVIAKLSELNDLIPKIFKIIKIDIVNPEYNKRIFIDCFKTFSPVIDESYDDEPDGDKRFRMILDSMHQLTKMDPKEVYKELEPILQHNYDHFYKNNWNEELFSAWFTPNQSLE